MDSCIQRVNDIINLTKCVEGVQETMASDNYETAASHINRYLHIDKKLISNIDDDVDGSFAVLKDAELRFINNLNNRFDSAVKENDEKGVDRFAQLYPLVGRKEDGLSKYSKFLASKVAAKGQHHLTNALKTSKDGMVLSYTLLYNDFSRIFPFGLEEPEWQDGFDTFFECAQKVHNKGWRSTVQIRIL